ncbi:MAG TPA: acyltransferase [Phenylobacterium sp.]|uniref:acyltransferase family protein n=1 Tax=Phenylobacterium sp. TaxID=1871053 RepID=UPI002B498346|nr:acyltransferase [Phenylobacterium sp.]HKR86687.1 acyltransferase [Phenylobacterium sp.]
MLKLRPLRAESDEMPHMDFMRFFGAISIVYFHYRGELTLPAPLTAFNDNLEGFRLLMEMFFAISGLAMARFYGEIATLHQYGGFLKKRIARLGPLHWLTAVLFMAMGLLVAQDVLHTNHPENYDFRYALPNLLLLHAWISPHLSFNDVSWSISAEWALYLILPLLLVIMRRGWAFPLALLLYGVLWVLPGDPWYMWTSNLSPLRALPSFLFGMAAFNARLTLAHLPGASWICGACLAAFVIGAGLAAPFPVLLAIILVAFTAGVAADYSGQGKRFMMKLAPLGSLTYSLYMVHPLYEVVFIIFVGQRLLHLGSAAMNAWVVLAIVLALVTSWLSLNLFEMPARRWISGLRLGARRGDARAAPARRLIGAARQAKE